MNTVSIVIPTYKNRGRLTDCVDSVLQQKCSLPFEILVVDDNDPASEYRKSTERLMTRYSDDDRVKYVKHEKNKNGSAARNTGIRVSNGDLIALLDDDDLFLEGKLEKQIEFMKEHPDIDAVCCFELKESVNEVNTKIHQGNATRDILMLQSNFQTSTLMLKRYVLETLNGFDESFIRHQDVEFMLRFYQAGFQLGCVPEVLVKMGKNDGGNIPTGEKLESLKSYFFSRFDGFIKQEDEITPGFANQVYAKHYAGVFLSHVKNHYWTMALKVFFKYFFKSPSTFWGVIYNSIKAHI